MKEFVAVGRLADIAQKELCLTKPAKQFGMVEVIRFSSRLALESFNRKCNLNALVKTPVPKGCAIYKHQIEV